MTTTTTLRGGTRASALARWQTARVAGVLRERTGVVTDEVVFTTAGDRDQERPLPEIGGKGLFTEEIEAALRAGTIDFAVHSLKDLPTETTADLVLVAVLLRADPRDVLVAPEPCLLTTLRPGASVGTCSTRRMAQLRAVRPDLSILPLRGNVDSRVRQALTGAFDAIVIAAAGVQRLGLEEAIVETLAPEVMLPAPGQGALAVQCRAVDVDLRARLAVLDDPLARAATDAERAFLEGLGGGCSAPIAALAEPDDAAGARLHLRGLVASDDGTRVIRVAGHGARDAARDLGRRLADQALAAGAGELLA